jgi:mRNA interferase RelE/StbE
LKVEFRESFLRDVRKIKDKGTLEALKKAIENVENAESLAEIASVKKMHGSRGYFRIRVGAYRIGLKLDSDTVHFVRFLNRREIYRYFP